MVFRKGREAPELGILGVRPGQNLEKTWNSGTDKVHKNDHN
jgi:hypothetical protein